MTPSPFSVKPAIEKFYNDLSKLMLMELSVQERFFFASLLHLVFVKIHPFDDGNGRASRLIEKWFLATKLGDKAWLLQSEKNYYQNHQTIIKIFVFWAWNMNCWIIQKHFLFYYASKGTSRN